MLINIKCYATGKTAAGRLAAINQFFTEAPKQNEDVRSFTARQEQLFHSALGGSISIDEMLGAATLYKYKTPQIAETRASKADAGAGNAFSYQLSKKAVIEKEQTLKTMGAKKEENTTAKLNKATARRLQGLEQRVAAQEKDNDNAHANYGGGWREQAQQRGNNWNKLDNRNQNNGGGSSSFGQNNNQKKNNEQGKGVRKPWTKKGKGKGKKGKKGKKKGKGHGYSAQQQEEDDEEQQDPEEGDYGDHEQDYGEGHGDGAEW